MRLPLGSCCNRTRATFQAGIITSLGRFNLASAFQLISRFWSTLFRVLYQIIEPTFLFHNMRFATVLLTLHSTTNATRSFVNTHSATCKAFTVDLVRHLYSSKCHFRILELVSSLKSQARIDFSVRQPSFLLTVRANTSF